LKGGEIKIEKGKKVQQSKIQMKKTQQIVINFGGRR